MTKKIILSIFLAYLLSKKTYISFPAYKFSFFRFLTHQATVGDDLPNYIISGRVLMKPNVTKFTETSAIFVMPQKEGWMVSPLPSLEYTSQFLLCSIFNSSGYPAFH